MLTHEMKQQKTEPNLETGTDMAVKNIGKAS